MKEILLTQGKVALVDDADFERVNAFKWHAKKDGRTFYAGRNIHKPNGRRGIQRLHHFLLPSILKIDHRDGNGLNNRRQNLRPATKQQNAQGFCHKKVGATSKFRGVCWFPRGLKWEAKITFSGRTNFLGYFELEESAARAYDAAARIAFKEFAHLNFP